MNLRLCLGRWRRRGRLRLGSTSKAPLTESTVGPPKSTTTGLASLSLGKGSSFPVYLRKRESLPRVSFQDLTKAGSWGRDHDLPVRRTLTRTIGAGLTGCNFISQNVLCQWS